jgi:UPF0176 protein
MTVSSTNSIRVEPTINVAAYKFVALGDLDSLRKDLKATCSRLGLKGTILLSEEGINIFVAGTRDAVDGLIADLRGREQFSDLATKESLTDHQPFNRMLVKIKREIIAFGIDQVKPASHTSPKISPEQLRQWLSEGRELNLLDVRNDYEVKLGTFQGAVDLGIHHFRNFPEAAKNLPESFKNRPTVMFCTGGIRCEKAGPFMEQLGFQDIYQLDGGILRYFELCGGDYYDGSCFVFDQRVAVDPKLQPTGVVQCFACQATLSEQEQASEKYVVGISCPYCFKSKEEQQELLRARHEKNVRKLAATQPGCTAYENRRMIHVPRAMAGKLLLEFLMEYVPGTNSEYWRSTMQAGQLLCDRGRCEPEQTVREGERFLQIEPNTVEPPINPNIVILHEDASILVINKPAPLPVHPSGRFNRNSLLYFLSQIYSPEKMRIAHRLDANTTGLVVVCRKYSSSSFVQRQFTEGKVDKVYLARVRGVPPQSEFECDVAIVDEADRAGARQVDPSGQSCLTKFQLIKTYADGTSLLKAIPVTGRTNQIRIHLWQLGMPVVNDPLYLPDRQMGTDPVIPVGGPAMGLHAWKLTLEHPETRRNVTFEAMPDLLFQ